MTDQGLVAGGESRATHNDCVLSDCPALDRLNLKLPFFLAPILGSAEYLVVERWTRRRDAFVEAGIEP